MSLQCLISLHSKAQEELVYKNRDVLAQLFCQYLSVHSAKSDCMGRVSCKSTLGRHLGFFPMSRILLAHSAQDNMRAMAERDSQLNQLEASKPGVTLQTKSQIWGTPQVSRVVFSMSTVGLQPWQSFEWQKSG